MLVFWFQDRAVDGSSVLREEGYWWALRGGRVDNRPRFRGPKSTQGLVSLQEEDRPREGPGEGSEQVAPGTDPAWCPLGVIWKLQILGSVLNSGRAYAVWVYVFSNLGLTFGIGSNTSVLSESLWYIC